MSTGSVPAVWKTAVVTPVYKSGLSSEPSNYWPISLTSVFCKLMERIIVTEMLQCSKKHGLISNQQHGFLSKRSTATNLLESLDDWTCAFVNRNSAFIAYIDFKKAFDSVCHKKLFARLASLGFSGVLLKFIQSLLTGRTQRTRVGNIVSLTQ